MDDPEASLLLLISLGCATGAFAPDVDPGAWPGIEALPADATVVAAGDVRALEQHPLARSLGADLALADTLDDAGLPADPALIEAAVVGCGSGGCVGLVRGAVAALAPGALPTAGYFRVDDGEEVALLAPRGPGLRVGREGGQLRVGDGTAFSRRGLDAASIAALVPAGDAWLLVRDPERLLDQAAGRLELEGTEEAAALATRARGAIPMAESVGVRAIAVSLDLSEAEVPALRVRVRTDGRIAALGAERLLSARLEALPGDAGQMWREASHARDAAGFELTARATVDRLDELLATR